MQIFLRLNAYHFINIKYYVMKFHKYDNIYDLHAIDKTFKTVI